LIVVHTNINISVFTKNKKPSFFKGGSIKGCYPKRG
jgi:hypothetical protein